MMSHRNRASTPLHSLGLTLAFCVMLTGPDVAHATFPGREGSIAIREERRDRGGHEWTDLRLISPRGQAIGGSLQRCEQAVESGDIAPGCPSGPAFSADGRKLAYAVSGRLVVANFDGTGARMLPKLTKVDVDPTWTKRGKLLFTGQRGHRRNLYFVGADGTGLRQLTRRGGRRATYSNNGLIAYVAGGWIRLIRPDGSGGRRFARGMNPDFSPSGRSIVYTSYELFIKRVRRGSKRRRLGIGSEPVFSPTGRRILFSRYFEICDQCPLGPTRLYTISTRGKNRRLVYDPGVSPPEVADPLNPAWQPRR